MAKRKKGKSNSIKEALTPEEQASALTDKIDRLKTLQDRREQSRYIQILKGAENRISHAQLQKGQALVALEKANQGIKAAEANLEFAASEVAVWEGDGMLSQRVLIDVAKDQKVMISHQSQGLGVVPLPDTEDPRWLYGIALTDAKAGDHVIVKKAHPSIPEFGEDCEAEAEEAEIEVAEAEEAEEAEIEEAEIEPMTLDLEANSKLLSTEATL